MILSLSGVAPIKRFALWLLAHDREVAWSENHVRQPGLWLLPLVNGVLSGGQNCLQETPPFSKHAGQSKVLIHSLRYIISNCRSGRPQEICLLTVEHPLIRDLEGLRVTGGTLKVPFDYRMLYLEREGAKRAARTTRTLARTSQERKTPESRYLDAGR